MAYRIDAESNDAILSDARFSRDDSAGDRQDVGGGFVGQIWQDEKVWFAQMVRKVFPIKTAMAIVEYSGCPERSARNYESAHSEPPARILRDLLRGKEGDAVLAYIMRTDAPAWWAKHQSCERKAKLFDEFMERGGALNVTS